MINWQNGVTPINETNMNKLIQEDDNSNVTSNIINSTSDLVSVKNANFETLSGLVSNFTTKKSNSTVLVFVTVGGLYNDNTGYDISFTVRMDDTTNATSGVKGTNNADWRANWSTDGSTKVRFSDMFVFTGVSKGQHSFVIRWSSNNNNVTAYTGNYAKRSMTIVEI